jgi:hypothetical protein
VRPLRFVPWAGIAALSLLASCGAEDDPVSPAPGRHTMRGHVTLTGHLVNAQGTFAGTQVVRDADGIPVDLLSGSTVIAQTMTTDGAYSFSGLLPGAYQTRATLIPRVGDLSAVLTVVSSDLNVGDTLRLVSYGDLLPIPNPVETETIIYFEIPESLNVSLQVLTLAADTVQTLLVAKRPPGINQVRWDGLDRFGSEVPAGNYWVTFAAGADQRAQLLFKVDPPVPLAPVLEGTSTPKR